MTRWMRVLAQLICAAILTVVSGGAGFAADPGAGEVQATISGQIDAFRHDDGAKAYSYAAPSIQMMFPSVEAFMAMVKTGYAPVYHPRDFQFSRLEASGDRFVQTVEITAADGTNWTAEYTLARAADGSLKIEGCRLEQRPGIGA